MATRVRAKVPARKQRNRIAAACRSAVDHPGAASGEHARPGCGISLGPQPPARPCCHPEQRFRPGRSGRRFRAAAARRSGQRAGQASRRPSLGGAARRSCRPRGHGKKICSRSRKRPDGGGFAIPRFLTCRALSWPAMRWCRACAEPCGAVWRIASSSSAAHPLAWLVHACPIEDAVLGRELAHLAHSMPGLRNKAGSAESHKLALERAEAWFREISAWRPHGWWHVDVYVGGPRRVSDSTGAATGRRARSCVKAPIPWRCS